MQISNISLSLNRRNLIGIEGNLDRNCDQVGVLLDFAGNTHVDVLIADRNDHSSDDGWVDLGAEMDGFVGLDEFLQRENHSELHNSDTDCLHLTFNCDSNSLRCEASRGLAEMTSHTTSPR